MTDSRLTQAAAEQWSAPLPNGQTTQVAVEHWATVTATGVCVVATQIAVEHWAVAPAAGGTQTVGAMVLA